MAYTTIDDPSAYFQAYAFSKSSGAGSATFDGNSDLQPDFLWVKSRTNADSHEVWDSTRGVSSTLFSNNTEAQDASDNRLSSFNSDGFSWGTAGNLNAAGDVVSWAWKANGGTTSSNTDGAITSTVQSDTTAGFSLVTYTGNGSDNQTIGHGLGVQPSWWIVKRRDSTGDWWFGASSILGGTSNYLKLNSAAANAEINNIWGDSPTSSTLFRVSNNAGLNASGGTYVAYLFANKQGYSKFGKYTGNGNVNGPFVYTGFKPAFVMVKSISAVHNWHILDNKRDPENVVDKYLNPDNAAADATFTFGDFLSNGFKWRSSSGTSFNESGTSYIYMAFAENPFVTSTGIPTTAR